MLHEGIVLFGSTFGQWLEPVCIMSYSIFLSPKLHAGSHSISDGTIQTSTIVYHIDEFLVHIRRKILVHLLAVEYILGKVLRRAHLWSFHLYRSFLKGLGYNLKSQISHSFIVFYKFASAKLVIY